jgi:hypothetical protein
MSTKSPGALLPAEALAPGPTVVDLAGDVVPAAPVIAEPLPAAALPAAPELGFAAAAWPAVVTPSVVAGGVELAEEPQPASINNKAVSMTVSVVTSVLLTTGHEFE